MGLAIMIAFAAGMLVTLSRQLNGRMAMATSALGSSFWNHLVGLGALIPYAVFMGSVWPADVGTAPWFAWVGGALGVVFVASGSWLITRLGAAMTGGLLVAGQMISGVLMDLLRSHPASAAMQLAGVTLIIVGVLISRRRQQEPHDQQSK